MKALWLAIAGAFALPLFAATPSAPTQFSHVSTVSSNAGVSQGLLETKVCTVALTGVHTYNAHTDAELDAVPWGTLAAGDVVNIFAKDTPFKVKFGLRAQGTAAQPVTVNGVSDAACNKPAILGLGSRTASGAANVFKAVNYEQLGAVVVTRGVGDAYGVYEPKFIVIQGIKVSGVNPGGTFTTLAGASATFGSNGCIWLQNGQDITVRNVDLSDCAFGLFVMAKDDLLSETTVRLTVQNSRVYANGVVNSYSEHGFYVQSVDPLIEGNFIGQNRLTSQGSSYKDRSAGTIFRHNYIICTALCLDFVQSEDQKQDGIVKQPQYGTDYVYANTIVGTGQPVIHYGGDNMGEQDSNGNTATVFVPPVPYRKHLRFWGNTFVSKSTDYKDHVFRLSAAETEVDAWNNSFDISISGPELSWLYHVGTLRLGPGNVLKTKTPNLEIQVGTLAAAAHSITTGAPIPNDPRLATLQ